MVEVKDYALVRPPMPQILTAGDRRFEVNSQGDQIGSNVLPERAQIVSQGNSWVKTTDAIACVTAIPTTTAAHTFWFNDPTKCAIIDRIVWTCTTSNGAATMGSLVGLINFAKVATVPSTSDTATTVNGLTGKTYSGYMKSSHGATVVNDTWFAIGTANNTAALTATVGFQFEVFVNGLIIMPPGGSLFSLSCVAQSTTMVGKVSLFWHEVPLILG
jgi:hypothetical protein